MSDASPDKVRNVIDQVMIKLDFLSSATHSNAPRGIEMGPDDLLELRRALTKMRNAHTPIFKLPNEIFVEIFTIVDHADNIAQICSHWRFLALGTPALWTKLPSHHHNRTLRFLERSKNSPLDVCISRATSVTTTSAILKNIGRIRILHVNQSRKNLLGMQKIRRHAPLLEELSIEKWCDGDFGVFSLWDEAFGITARLRKLDLNNICFHWCILLNLPALTHLSLHDVTVTHDTTGEEFTNTLRKMPLLQVLSMSFGDIELNKYSPATDLGPIHLPQLTDLDIRPRSPSRHINHFLSHATLPQLRTLHIDYGDDEVDHSPMVRTLASAVQSGKFYPLGSLTISSDFFRIKSLPYKPDDGSYIEAYFPVTQEDLVTDDFAMATLILSCITPTGSNELSSLVRLEIESLKLDDFELQELFGELPYLEHVEFSSELADSFVEALSIPLDHSPDSPLFFPSLNSIEWYGMDMRDSPYPDRNLFDNFIDCLMQRCEYGAPIHDLVLKGCNLAVGPAEALLLLSEVVVNVSVSASFW